MILSEQQVRDLIKALEYAGNDLEHYLSSGDVQMDYDDSDEIEELKAMNQRWDELHTQLSNTLPVETPYWMETTP